jgi:hypothetical protein
LAQRSVRGHRNGLAAGSKIRSGLNPNLENLLMWLSNDERERGAR